MDAPDAAWFERHNGPDRSWTGPGLVVNADYSQFYLYGEDTDLTWGFDGSLAGVTPEGNVVFTTAHRYGPVAVQIDVQSSAPEHAADSGWEAESSFVLPIVDASLQLVSWAGYGPSYDLELPPGDHHALVRRASWGRAYDDRPDEVSEFFLVQLWPTGATTVSDALRQLRADREAEAEAARESAARLATARHRAEMWNGLEPPAELERLGNDAASVARGSFDLALSVARADVATARRIAAWAVETVAAEIGQPPIDLAPVVSIIRAGVQLPPPFDDVGTAFDALLPRGGEDGFGHATFGSTPGRPGPISPSAATCAAILSTDVVDPVAGAMAALNDAASGVSDKPAFWRAAEAEFHRLR